MRNECIWDLLFNIVNEYLKVDLLNIDDEAALKEYYHSIMSVNSTNVIYLVDALEKKFGTIPQEYLSRYDLRYADETIELIKMLQDRD